MYPSGSSLRAADDPRPMQTNLAGSSVDPALGYVIRFSAVRNRWPAMTHVSVITAARSLTWLFAERPEALESGRAPFEKASRTTARHACGSRIPEASAVYETQFASGSIGALALADRHFP